MFSRMCRAALALAGAVAVFAPAVPAPATATAAHDADRPVPRWMEVSRIDGGFQYRASRHVNQLTITRTDGRIRFADTRSRVLRDLPRGCRRAHAETGLAVTCRIPAGTSAADPLLLRVEPGAGDDRADASTLGAEFDLTALLGPGDDEYLGGAGPDFVNGADGVDQVTTGPGADEVRLGDGDDAADGGGGDDRLVGTAGNDQLTGSIGNDVLEGGNGNDLLLGGPGEDSLLCGGGVDTTDDDGQFDEPRHCELTVP